MLKKLKAAPTVDITWQGEVAASVRGLSPADVAALLVSVGVHLPTLMAQLIARAADAADDWEMVRDHYSFVLQFDILAEIAKLTFNEPEGFRRFVGNVLLLVDLAGTLTSGSKKRPKTRAARPSSAAG